MTGRNHLLCCTEANSLITARKNKLVKSAELNKILSQTFSYLCIMNFQIWRDWCKINKGWEAADSDVSEFYVPKS